MNVAFSQVSNKSVKSQSSIIKPKKLKTDEKRNKKLVTMLNHKMFKGYRQIKKVTNSAFDLNKFMRKAPNEYYPLDDDYNIYYRQKFLSSLKANYSFNDSINIQKCPSSNNYRNEQLKKTKAQCDLFLTKPNPNDSKYSYPSCNSYKNLFLNEEEKQIYSNLPFLILNKNDDPCNYMGNPSINAESYKGRNSKRSIGVSCSEGKNNLLTSLSSSALKEQEAKRLIKIEKQKMALSQSEFLFKLSHHNNLIDNSKLNFMKNKGLYHNKTMTNLFLQKKSEDNNNNAFYHKFALESNPVLKIEVISQNKNTKNNPTKKGKINLIKGEIDNIYHLIDHFGDNISHLLDEDENPISNHKKIVYVNQKSGPSSNESEIMPNNSNLKKPSFSDEEKKNKKEKYLFMKSTIFGPNSTTPKGFSGEESTDTYANDFAINMKQLLDRNKVKKNFFFSISNDSNLLKKSTPSHSNIYAKQSNIKDRLILSMLSKTCSKNELDEILSKAKYHYKMANNWKKEQI